MQNMCQFSKKKCHTLYHEEINGKVWRQFVSQKGQHDSFWATVYFILFAFNNHELDPNFTLNILTISLEVMKLIQFKKLGQGNRKIIIKNNNRPLALSRDIVLNRQTDELGLVLQIELQTDRKQKGDRKI